MTINPSKNMVVQSPSSCSVIIFSASRDSSRATKQEKTRRKPKSVTFLHPAATKDRQQRSGRSIESAALSFFFSCLLVVATFLFTYLVFQWYYLAFQVPFTNHRPQTYHLCTSSRDSICIHHTDIAQK